jgi:hypothetical protein
MRMTTDLERMQTLVRQLQRAVFDNRYRPTLRAQYEQQLRSAERMLQKMQRRHRPSVSLASPSYGTKVAKPVESRGAAYWRAWAAGYAAKHRAD